ncbi:hypothetical protein KP509_09G009700 [Ceratopteris richardii]|nr:hypothetical protein KP509_09G009700 [Ceratopteris richardii]
MGAGKFMKSVILSAFDEIKLPNANEDTRQCAKLMDSYWCSHTEESNIEQIVIGSCEENGAFWQNSNPSSNHDDSYERELVSSLKDCAKRKDLQKGSEIHAQIVQKGLLQKNAFIGSALINMYAKCGALKEAKEVFDELPVQNVVLWNTLITGYAQNGNGEMALRCFDQMKKRDFSPNAVTFVSVLKACGSLQALQKGCDVHEQVLQEKSCERNTLVANALLDMYIKCGDLGKAHEVFDNLAPRDVVSWTIMIAGYTQYGRADKALQCFDEMQSAGFHPDPATFCCVLKACGSIGDLEKGQIVHNRILRARLLGRNVKVANALVAMYAKCGALKKAQQVFDGIPNPNSISWNTLISGLVQYEQDEDALTCFKRMQLAGCYPDAVTFTCILKVCGNLRTLDLGEEIHKLILKAHLLEEDIVVANALVDMYVRCGEFEKAIEVFDKLPVHDVVSWNVLIGGYAQHGYNKQALKCFYDMQARGVCPNPITFSFVLKVCSNVGDLEMGEKLQTQILREHMFEQDIGISNAVIDMYSRCGSLIKAREVFNAVSKKNTATWNALIAGYCQHGHYEEALGCFRQMQLEGFRMDEITASCMFKVCGNLRALDEGNAIHLQAVKEGLLEGDVVGTNALIDMYTKCNALEEAQNVFDKLHDRNAVSWNVLIGGYSQKGYANVALELFNQMQAAGCSPDAVTLASVLTSCGSAGALDQGQEIHMHIVKWNLLDTDIVLAGALVDMYAQCGSLQKAQQVFDELPLWNTVSWTVLINGYVQHGHGEKALNCFEKMNQDGLIPDAATLACLLRTCGHLGAAYKGEEIHAEIAKHQFLENDMNVGLALINMYAKCGMLVQAQEFFEKLQVRDVMSWSALLGGYSQVGKDEIVLELFDKMIGEGVVPDSVVFTIILNACSHRGLINEGQALFEMMAKSFHIVPTEAHHTCMLDLFGRSGYLDKAAAMIEKMSYSMSSVMWENFLGACHKWGAWTLGRWAFEHALGLDRKDSAIYAYMHNIYHSASFGQAAAELEFTEGRHIGE